MTALKEFARLETIGSWRPEPEAAPREVTVSFGEATLVLSDQSNRPVTHWSLPALNRLNPGETPALYAPDEDASETLEIDDETMIGALEKVRRAVAARQPRPGRLRQGAIWGGLGLAAFLAVFWLPGALMQQTLGVVPPGKRSEFGATLLGMVQSHTGPTCRDPLGSEALNRLRDRTLGRDGGQIVVVPDKLAGPIYLPGGIVVLPGSLLDETEDPVVVAGHVIAAAASRDEADPLDALLREAGFGTVLRLLTTGDIPTEKLQDRAERLVATPAPVPGDEVLLDRFAKAGVPIGPWARATGEGPDAAVLVAAEAGAARGPVLSDGDWVSLQGICRG
ncbi:hypothetical protein [Limimaricola pyoseonensis]|uniref:Uncharacterized protein n=1 Tax=Limimaricola pyoseonensis TaxID=521013 RepID=A0A1G7GC00_9RHOB|nr:hypothetical protein [Limimaricola pyoseonensis]SDE85668.1 hypothetical protein SAMN04488567_2830 [Limimaricola pyoseonensis]